MYSRSCRAISIAGFEYEGKHYTIYEGSQLQRKLETAVRYAKEEQLTAAAYGDTAWAAEAQNKVRVLKEKYVSVSEAAGLPVKSGGTHYQYTTKQKLGKANNILIYSFWFYNKFLALFRTKARNLELAQNELLETLKHHKSKYISLSQDE